MPDGSSLEQKLFSPPVFIQVSVTSKLKSLEGTKVKRTILGLVLLGMMGSATMFAQNGYWAQRNNDSRWRDYRNDRRDIRRDYVDRRNDWRDIHRDNRNIAYDRWEMRRDLRNGNYAAARQERTELRNEYRDLNRDRRDVRHDTGDVWHDRRDLRRDRRDWR